MKKYKFTILYYGLIIVPPALLLLVHFYAYTFGSYDFTEKDVTVFFITALLAACGAFIAIEENYHS